MKVTLIACTLNEIETVPKTLPLIDRSCVDEIIVVDGGSTDGTIEWCRANGYTVHSQASRGYGAGIRDAVAIAQGDIIIEYPPDGSSKPEYLRPLIQKITGEGYDFVVASRYKDGAKSEDDDALTGVGNWGFTTATNILFGTRYTDVLVGYRAYRKALFYTLGLDANGLSWPLQESIRFARAGHKVTEIGADEPKRVGGERKMRPFKTGMEILKIMMRELFKRPPYLPSTSKSAGSR